MSLHLKSIKLNNDIYCLKKDLYIDLKPITLLVGDQGCGKSTLLELILNNKKDEIEIDISDEVIKNGINSFYFDSEKMNPRITDPEMYTNPNGTSRGIGLHNALASRFLSHGEVLVDFTVNRLKDAKDCVLLLDEPESALSLKNQFKLAKEVKKVIKRNNQIIIATHCLPLIESIKEVYSLEHLKWFSSKEFIQLNK